MSAFSSLECLELWRRGQGHTNVRTGTSGPERDRMGRLLQKTQLGRTTYIFFERVQDEGFELTQTLVDPGSSPLLHDRLGRLRGHTGHWDDA